MRKSKIVFVTVLVVMCLIAGCERQEAADEVRVESVTEEEKYINPEWIGSYTLSEYHPPDMNWYYEVEVIRDDESDIFYARLSVDGFQTMYRMLLDITQKDDVLYFHFKEGEPEGMNPKFEEGDVLFTLHYDNKELITEWEGLSPALEESKKDGFEKVVDLEKNTDLSNRCPRGK